MGESLLVLRGHWRCPVAAFGRWPVSDRLVAMAPLGCFAVRRASYRYRSWTRQVVSLQFSPDGQRLMSSSRDGTAAVWDLKNAEQLASLPSRGVSDARWLTQPDGKLALLNFDRAGARAAPDEARSYLRYFDASS